MTQAVGIGTDEEIEKAEETSPAYPTEDEEENGVKVSCCTWNNHAKESSSIEKRGVREDGLGCLSMPDARTMLAALQ